MADSSKIISPFSRPVYLMAKPAGARCNLACSYCYYTEKSKLYPMQGGVMSDELLERFTREYIEMQTMGEVLFTWHGGETMMRPLSFYKKAVDLQRKYARGRIIQNALQTNGTLLTPEWCRFLKENDWLVGLSIDGPQEFHDEYRATRQGHPSFQQVMKGIQLLNDFGVKWNAMAVVNDYNADYPLEFYHFFKDIGCHYIQFAPIVERFRKHSDGRYLASPNEKDAEMALFSVTPQQWGNFLCGLFDEWVKQDVGNYYIQLFDSTLANWIDEQPGVCMLAETCGHAGVIEFNGDVYSCDHFVFPEYRLGNIYHQPLLEMMNSRQQRDFGMVKKLRLTRQCQECRYLFACHGECPKNRFTQSRDGEQGHNYLCDGYYKFFEHVAPYMDFMANQLRKEQPPAAIMDWIKAGRPDYR